ncbi:MAG TPA: M1 family metallopeptidase [Steroidobacteraceae bacterium]|nr:M1 family metallopeptidase [Steroidobacteraceae bacterium]
MKRFACGALLLGTVMATAATAAEHFDPAETFARLTLPESVNGERGPDGAPGPAYWQNRADYSIRARLLPATRELSGDELITYTNNSPQRLGSLWLQLDQNMYRADARAAGSRALLAARLHLPLADAVTQGFGLDAVEVERGGKRSPADTLVSDTRLQIRLAQPLPPHGTVRLHIRYHYTVPGVGGGRTGWVASRNGDIYAIAQWYPRMAVFDDLRGWDTLPYIGAEFYLEYGDFDYYLTVPSDMLVVGSGELVNPQDVLTGAERARLERARHSDATVMIRGPADVADAAARPRRSAELTWHFRMHQTRDVAFAASRAFIWDAARINLPDHKTALAMSVYPVESAGESAWGRSTQYFKDAVEHFSQRWYPYPWPVAVNVAGPVSAMEYPGMAFDELHDAGKTLFIYSAHEIGHSWFPMIVGTNERRDTWMDEGFNTFIDIFESDDFNHGEFGPKRDNEYAAGGGNPVEEIQGVLKDPAAPVLLTNGDAIGQKYSHTVSYFKSALGLTLLREQILGPARFDYAFRKFIRDWAYRHPSPSDFFRTMDSAGGEDLSWFWRGWYFNNWDLDLAVTHVTYTDGDPARGATVSLANRDRLVMPATLQVVYADGTRRRIPVPVETWLTQREAQIALGGGGPITEVTVDPDQVLPDEDRSNNTLQGPF